MSYQQVIMCVDVSGSMSGDKIQKARNYLNQMAAAYSCKTVYFKFTTSVQQIASYTEETLRAGGGTSIESCLNDLYGKLLPQFAGCNTKFIFVTDAEDSIYNVSSVQAMKRQCERAFNGNLHSYCHLVGGSGGCSKELDQIFGSQSFGHVQETNFGSSLKEITGGIKKAQKLEKVEMNVKTELIALAKDNDAENRKAAQDLQKVLDDVKQIKEKTEAAQRELSQTQTNVEQLDRQKVNVSTQVQAARSEGEVDAAEEAAEALKSGYQAEGERLTAAGEQLESARADLQVGSKRANDVAAKLKASSQKLSDMADKVISNIIAGIKELESIQSGSYEQVQSLRKRFRSSLDELMVIVKKNSGLESELKEAQSNILGALKNYNRNKSTLDQLKQSVLSNIEAVNRLLEQLDGRC